MDGCSWGHSKPCGSLHLSHLGCSWSELNPFPRVSRSARKFFRTSRSNAWAGRTTFASPASRPRTGTAPTPDATCREFSWDSGCVWGLTTSGSGLHPGLLVILLTLRPSKCPICVVFSRDAQRTRVRHARVHSILVPSPSAS